MRGIRAGRRGTIDRAPLCAVLLALLCAAIPAPSLADTLPETIRRIKPSVVGVGSVLPTRNPPANFRGTGVVVMDGRYVLTNNHVVPRDLSIEKREFLAVFTGQAQRADARRAHLVAHDPEHDLALLRIEGEALPAVEFGDWTQVREGEVYAFTGFPIGTVLGLYPVTHRATIASITPVVIPVQGSKQLSITMLRRLQDPYDVFQLDATAYPGNSGSPLYDPRSGKVVGIINKVLVTGGKESVLSEPSGITFAIPAGYALELIKRVSDRLP